MSSIIKNNALTRLNPNHLTTNLAYLMQKVGVDATTLSQATGIALTTINSLKRGSGNPTLLTLQSICDYFNVSLGDIMESNLSAKVIKPLPIEIPLLDIQRVSDFFSHPNQVKETILIEVEKTQDKYVAIKFTNNSMAPLFEKGTIFVLCVGMQPLDGDLVLVQFNHQLPCFRKVYIEDDASYIFSPIGEIINGEISKSKNFHLHGVVIKSIQNFHD